MALRHSPRSSSMAFAMVMALSGALGVLVSTPQPSTAMPLGRLNPPVATSAPAGAPACARIRGGWLCPVETASACVPKAIAE